MEIEVSKEVAPAYVAHVLPILQNAKFQQLGRYTHHFWTNRLMHSLNVSYLSWRMAQMFGCDESVAARAGLLHDFCLYDFHEKTPTGEHQAFYHPKVAAKTARKFSRSVSVNGMQFCRICSRLGLFRETKRHGSSPWQTRSAH